MQRYQDSIILSTGQAVVGASVQVLTYPAGAVATIYSDNGSTTTTNPLITDGNGHFAFYAADARYSLVITKVGIAPITVSDILLEDPADGSAALSASGGAALVGFLPSGINAIARTLQSKGRDRASIFDYLTTAQITDVLAAGYANDLTTAFNNALAEHKEIECPGGGGYLIGAVSTQQEGNRLIGIGYPTLRGKAGTYSMVSLAHNNCVVDGFYVDDFTLLTNNSSSAGIKVTSNNNAIRNCTFPQVAISTQDVQILAGGLTTILENVHGNNLLVKGTGASQATTIVMASCSWTFESWNDVAGCTVIGNVVQGTTGAGYPAKMIDILTCDALTFMGGDLEGDAGRTAYTIQNSNKIRSSGHDLRGFAGTYLNDVGGNTYLAMTDQGWTYKKGTVTVTAACGTSGTITLSTNVLSYERFGDSVRLGGRLIVGSVSAPVGTLTINGIPYSGAGGNQNVIAFTVNVDGATAGNDFVANLSGTGILISSYAAGARGAAAGLIQAGTVIDLGGMYAV